MSPDRMAFSGTDEPRRGAAAHSVLGLSALLAEMASQGVPLAALLQDTGLDLQQIEEPQTCLTLLQKMSVFRNVARLTTVPEVGLRAGLRQRLSDFGLFGYALISSRTLGDAIAFGVKHVQLAGPVLQKRFRVEQGSAVFEGVDVLALGDLLPLVTEFWFSSIFELATCILGRPLPSHRLLLPYDRPTYAASYEERFQCPVEFSTGVMEWHFDASVMGLPCPNANPLTAELCMRLCERMLEALPAESNGVGTVANDIRAICLDNRGTFPNADEVAARLGVSVRTLRRRLAQEGKGYQDVIDELRHTLAVRYLRDTSLSVEEVADRVGFSEASNFRKAFRRWTGQAPGEFRNAA